MKRKLLANLCIIAVIMFCATTAWGAVLLGTKGFGLGASSTLVEIDPETGATTRIIGQVEYLVNGLDYDATTGKLYGSTAQHDPNHNGLIEIDVTTGKGTPIGASNWGDSHPEAITNITVDSVGQIFGYSEFDPQDELVSIDKTTGVATKVGDSGYFRWTAKYGLSFDNSDTLYLFNGFFTLDGITYDGMYHINTVTGFATYLGSIGSVAHHGDFHPSTNLYYGISSTMGDRELLVVDPSTGLIVSTLSELDDDIHTLVWIRDCKDDLVDANATIADQAATIAGLEADLAAANATIADQAATIAGLEADLAAANATIAARDATIATLTDDLAAANDNIEALEAENDQLQMVIDSLVTSLLKKSNADANAAIAVKNLAQEAIDQAKEGGKAKEIEKAQKEMDKALKELDHTKKDGDLDPKYDKAIDHYKKAWEHAQKAMK